MSEAALWARLRKGMEGHGHFQRIETGAIAAGVPDVNYCIDGVEGWLELKFAAMPKRSGTVVFRSQAGLSPEQVEWLTLRSQHGGRCWVLVQVGKELMLLPGARAAAVNLLTVGEMVVLARWWHTGACIVDDWRGLREILRG